MPQPNSSPSKPTIYLTEWNIHGQLHQHALRLVSRIGARRNLGAICKQKHLDGTVHLDLQPEITGQIANLGGDFLNPGNDDNPSPQNALGHGHAVGGATYCWGGTGYAAWRAYSWRENAVAYLKRHFDVQADPKNTAYTQGTIDRCLPGALGGEAAAEGVREEIDLARPSQKPLPTGVSRRSILEELVRQIHTQSFQRRMRHQRAIHPAPGAPIVKGWQERVKEYAYARQCGPHFTQVYRDTLPFVTQLTHLRASHTWTASMNLPSSTRLQISQIAQAICIWGGVQQRDYSRAWEVVRDAILAKNLGSCMNSGWTKVASMATVGMPGTEQTIWDSRVASSIIWRIDQILLNEESRGKISTAQAQAIVKYFDLGTVPSMSVGTRPRALKYDWPNGYGRWRYHFNGSKVVREIVSILNDPKNFYPRMPQPTFDRNFNYTGQNITNWTVFGAGLVLFMDGW